MLVDRLEAAGWVVRRPHPSDRRYILIELSAQAAEHAPTGLATYHSSVQSLVAGVPSPQRRHIATFLQAAAEAASKATQDFHRGPDAAGRRQP